MKKAARPSLLFTKNSVRANPYSKSLFDNVFNKIILHFKPKKKVAELCLTGSPQIRKLNREFRKKDKSTDVLSFDSNLPNLLGSIIIDVQTAKHQAREQKHSVRREIQELFIHGVLHLLGFDHQTKNEAKIMGEYEHKFSVHLNAKR